MKDRSPFDEALLARLVAGELADDGPEAARLEADDPDFRARLEELRRLQAELDEAGLRRRVLDEARDQPWELGQARLAVALAGPGSPLGQHPAVGSDKEFETQGADEVRPVGIPHSGSRRRSVLGIWIAGLVAAAGLVLGLRWMTWSDGGEPDRSMVFLGEALPGAEPAGPTAGYDRIRWDLELPPGWSFRVRVIDDTDEGAGRLVARSGDLDSSSWIPEDTSAWPARILWAVDQRTADGRTVEGQLVRSWLSRP